MNINKRKEGKKTMGKPTELEKFKIDNAVVDFLFEHKGKENAVTGKDILAVIRSVSTTDCLYEGGASAFVRKLMLERRLPICHNRGRNGGYYWAKTKEEILESISDLQGTISSIQETIEHLQSFIF